MNVLIIGYEEALSTAVTVGLATAGREIKFLSIDDALHPTVLSGSVSSVSRVVLITTDTFLGITQDLDKTLLVATEVFNEGLRCEVPVTHIGSVLSLGRGTKGELISATTDWTDDLDWDNQAFMMHRIDREFHRAMAEGLDGHSVLLPIVNLSDRSKNVAYGTTKVLLDKKIYPAGGMGVLHEGSLLESLKNLLGETTGSAARRLLVDENLTYQQWLENHSDDKIALASMKPFNPPKKGMLGFIGRFFRKAVGAKRPHERILSTNLEYILDQD